MGIWISGPRAGGLHAAFRGHFSLDTDCDLELRTLGASAYAIYIAGEYRVEGPLRFVPGHAEYTSTKLKLTAGNHVLAVHATDTAEPTRMMVERTPFLDIQVLRDGAALPLAWKCAALPGYHPGVRRVNPQLGWIEWCDTRADPNDWTAPTFDDSKWSEPVSAEGEQQPSPPTIDPVRRIEHSIKPTADGTLTDTFGYELDDPAARFFLRDLSPALPPQGVWRRYDLARVRLGRLALILDLPAGAIVEFAYSESLAHDRVNPFITLSTGQSCNLDHYVARGGQQTFTSLESRGGRFAEVHVVAPPDKVRFIRETYLERTYHAEPTATFHCSDELLNRIWTMGLNSYRSCSEDAIIDNPTRERGQWTGDAYVGMETASAGYGDLKLSRRALLHAAQNARGDGLVSGLTPGASAISTYALQWVTACVRYHQLSGDKQFLDDLFPAAVKNLHAFEPFVVPDGLNDGAGWAFIDWGYSRPPGPVDLALNLHYLFALRSMRTWCSVHGWKEDAKPYTDRTQQIEEILRPRFIKDPFESLGYHASVLGLRCNLVPPERIKDCVESIKKHWLTCFPNDPTAPRLSDPGAANPRIVTPYFAHYAFPALIEHGQIDFVLQQYRTCWGWMLSTSATTCLEVFDPRWSHCHQWSACPTWQLSRYVLGLHPRFDLGRDHFELNLASGSLARASGAVPGQDGQDGLVNVQWTRTDKGIDYRIRTPRPVVLHRGAEMIPVASECQIVL